MDVSSNVLSGNFDSAIFNSNALFDLEIANNNFSGVISFAANTNIFNLNASLNNFDTIQISPNVTLDFLYLSNNSIRTIPTEISYLSVYWLDLSYNKLEGLIPKELFQTFIFDDFGNTVDLSYNQLSGIETVTTSNFNSTNLILNNNNFNQSINELFTSLFNNNPGMLNVDLSHNMIFGEYTINTVEATGVYSLDLSQNKLTGSPYNLFPAFPNLYQLNISYNNFNGTLPQNTPNLNLFDIGYNNFEGSIDLFYNMGLVYASHNNFSSVSQKFLIPSDLDLSYNNIDGECLSYLISPNLQHLNLSHNKCTGSFPNDTMIPQNLFSIDLSYNNFNGSVSSLTWSGVLTSIYINNNNFTGGLPDFDSSFFIKDVDLSNNLFCGSVPDSWKQMTLNFCEISGAEILLSCGYDSLLPNNCLYNRTCDPHMKCYENQCETGGVCASQRTCTYVAPWSFKCEDCSQSPYIYNNDGYSQCSVSYIIIVIPIAAVVLILIIVVIVVRVRKSRSVT